MSVAEETFEFVSGFEPWQQDLFLRAAAAPALSRDDETAALALLLEDVGCGTARRVTRDDLIQAAGTKQPLELLAIENPTDVNALASGAVLRFDRANLNIVYGDNGAGKTGYSRIVKHVGRALQRESVLPDVLGRAARPGAPRARLRVRRGDHDSEYDIRLDQPEPPLLGAIYCYDSSCGDRYLTAANEIDYVPYAIETLRRLATAQTQLADRLDQRATDAAPGPLDLRPYPEGTRVRELLATLGPSSHATALVAAAHLSHDESERRTQLRRSVAAIEARQSAQLRAKATADAATARRLRDELAAAAQQLSPMAIATARQELEALTAAREALERQSSAKFAEAAVPGVGTDLWQVLWKAAREYGAQIGHPWPPEHDDAACLLCQTRLDDVARVRVAEIDEFFTHNIAAQVRAAERACEARRASLPDVEQLARRHQATLDALGRDPGQLGHRLAAWLVEAEAQRAQLIAGDQDGLAGVEAPLLGDIEQSVADKDAEASRHAALEDPAEQQRIRSELQEFDARAALAERLDETLSWLHATKHIHRLRQARAKLHTGAISRKQSELTAALVTNDLDAELRRQLKELNFTQIEVVSCRSKTERGKPQITLKLRTACDASLRQVLCDGEQRRLGIAMFLAEAVVANDGHPIVLDDPVSSVDHHGRRHIARTLVELAKRRQVIVFTHDLVFVGDLQRCAESQQLPVREQAVYRIGRVTGHVTEELPWAGQTVEKRIGALKSRLHQLKALDHRGDDPARYREQAEQFCNYLRQSFERAVEDKLLGGVVTRRDPAVHISQLDQVVCNEQVIALARRGVDENSPWVHDRARAENELPPTVEELREGLKLLQELIAVAKRPKHQRRRPATRGRDQLQLAPGLGRDAA